MAASRTACCVCLMFALENAACAVHPELTSSNFSIFTFIHNLSFMFMYKMINSRKLCNLFSNTSIFSIFISRTRQHLVKCLGYILNCALIAFPRAQSSVSDK